VRDNVCVDTRLGRWERHAWRITKQVPFGVFVESVDLPAKHVGLIDLAFMPEETRGQSQDDFPPVGAIVEATVQGYSPSGQLRLTMLSLDTAAKIAETFARHGVEPNLVFTVDSPDEAIFVVKAPTFPEAALTHDLSELLRFKVWVTSDGPEWQDRLRPLP
jgi:hypothetical protein